MPLPQETSLAQWLAACRAPRRLCVGRSEATCMHVACGPVCPKQITKRVRSNMLASKYLCQSEFHMPKKTVATLLLQRFNASSESLANNRSQELAIVECHSKLRFMRLNISEKFSGACILAYFFSGRRPCLHALIYARGCPTI